MTDEQLIPAASVLAQRARRRGFDARSVRLTPTRWRARVRVGARYVWIDEPEDLQWLIIDVAAGPIVDPFWPPVQEAA